MITTCITHLDGKKEIVYDKIVPVSSVEGYAYIEVPEDKIREIQECALDQVQSILNSLF